MRKTARPGKAGGEGGGEADQGREEDGAAVARPEVAAFDETAGEELREHVGVIEEGEEQAEFLRCSTGSSSRIRGASRLRVWRSR
jgi:hypothetical protein